MAEESQAECGVAADTVEAAFCNVGNLADGVGAQVGKFRGLRLPQTCSIGLISGT